MSTVTIPKKITKGDELVILSRREYKKLLRPAKKKLDHGLERALEDIRRGRVIGPFTNTKKLIQSLESK